MSTSSQYYRELEETFETDNKWLRRTLKSNYSEITAEEPTVDADITFIAIAKTVGKPDQVYEVASGSTQDIYAWASSPIFDLFNEISEILNFVETLSPLIEEPDEFEYQCTELWRKVIGLKTFLGTTDGFDEVISALLVIPANGKNSYLNQERITALKKGLTLVNHKFELSDEILDEFSNYLEDVGFDLNFVFGFTGDV